MKLARRDFLKSSLATSTAGLIGRTSAQPSPTQLIRKAIPSTGEMLPVIGFGTNQYGTGSDGAIRANLIETLSIFNKYGGKLVDTSSHYKGSEVVLGGLLAELGITKDVFLSTKCGQFDKNPLETKMSNSLAYLGVDQIDLYEIHNVVAQDWQTILPALREWKQDGKIRYLGITGSEDIEHEKIIQIMRTEPLDFVQINYNLGNRAAENVILPLAKERGIAVVGNVPFGQGELFAAISGREIPDFAKDFCQSWGNFFLKYNVSHPDILASIPGTTKPEHAIDNLGAAMGRLPTEAERAMQENFIASL